MEGLPPVLTDRAAFLLRLALGRAERMGERALATVGLSGREYGALALLAGWTGPPPPPCCGTWKTPDWSPAAATRPTSAPTS